MNELEQRRSSRIVIDFVVEYPVKFTAEHIAAILRDYIHLNRFVVGTAEVSSYPKDTRIVKQALSLATSLKDIKQ